VKAIERKFPGRLALLDPRTKKIETLAAAWGDAVPHAWSADHSHLLFTGLVDEFAQLFEFDVEKGEVRPITHGPEAHPAGCYGPDGSYLLMTLPSSTTSRARGSRSSSRAAPVRVRSRPARAITAHLCCGWERVVYADGSEPGRGG
jgi:Tol biopolymer transport system component